jgi:hypothetical protein
VTARRGKFWRGKISWANGATNIPNIARIHQQYPDWRHDWIEEYLIDWIEMDYAPEHYSTAQLEELDRLTERWVADHLRKAKTAKKAKRTRHS